MQSEFLGVMGDLCQILFGDVCGVLLQSEWLGLAGSIIIGIVISISIWQNGKWNQKTIKELKHDRELNNKIASANLSWKMLDIIGIEPYRTTLKQINVGESKNLKEDDIIMVLAHYEHIALFWKTKVLDDYHVLHQHGRNLKTLRNDKTVYDIFIEQRNGDDEYNFNHLNELFEKINKEIKD